MTRTTLILSMALLLPATSSLAQNRKPDLALKLYMDQSFDFRNAPAKTGFDTTMYTRTQWSYTIAPAMGLSYTGGRQGTEFFLHQASNRKFTTKEVVTDSFGNNTYVDVTNRNRQFSYSLEYTRDVSPARWSKLKTIVAVGLRHDMHFNQADNFPMEGEMRTRSHQVSLYLAPKVQYRLTDHFFMEAALPFTFFSHHYVRSRYTEKINPEVYKEASRNDAELRFSVTTLRLGVGYSF